VLKLRWDDIDWQGQRFTVTSPKTKNQGKPWRVVPLFPELLPYLHDCEELAEEGDEYVITRYRLANTNLRTQLLRILRRANVEAWPRLFQNLRASRETELANDFPLHVVTAWLGNTPTVAGKHYLQLTEAHFAEASQGGAGGGAKVVQQVVPQAPASNGSESQQTKEGLGLSNGNAIIPEESESLLVALRRAMCPPHLSNLRFLPAGVNTDARYASNLDASIAISSVIWRGAVTDH
jgi:hypothetical protein